MPNLGNYKQYVRMTVSWGGHAYPAYHLNPAIYQCDVYASIAKLKNHWIAGVTMTMKNNFGNTPCSLYGGECGPNGRERYRFLQDQRDATRCHWHRIVRGLSSSIRSQQPSGNASPERVGAAWLLSSNNYTSWIAILSDNPDYRELAVATELLGTR